jgi:hypothetical protein
MLIYVLYIAGAAFLLYGAWKNGWMRALTAVGVVWLLHRHWERGGDGRGTT